MWREHVEYAAAKGGMEAAIALQLFTEDGVAAKPGSKEAKWAFVPAADLLLAVGDGLVGITADGVFVCEVKNKANAGMREQQQQQQQNGYPNQAPPGQSGNYNHHQDAAAHGGDWSHHASGQVSAHNYYTPGPEHYLPSSLESKNATEKKIVTPDDYYSLHPISNPEVAASLAELGAYHYYYSQGAAGNPSALTSASKGTSSAHKPSALAKESTFPNHFKAVSVPNSAQVSIAGENSPVQSMTTVSSSNGTNSSNNTGLVTNEKKEKSDHFEGIALELCNIDEQRRHIALTRYMGPDSKHIEPEEVLRAVATFDKPTHVRLRRDPMTGRIEASYRPSDREEYFVLWHSDERTARLFPGTEYMPRMDVGISLNTLGMYRSVEFKDVSIQECPKTCYNASTGSQKFCGTAPTPCGTLECRATCSDRYECWNNRCLLFKSMGDMSSLTALTRQADKEEDELQAEMNLSSSTNRSNRTNGTANGTVNGTANQTRTSTYDYYSDPNSFMMRRFVFKNGKFLPRCGHAIYADDEANLHIINIKCEEANRICSEGACTCKPHTLADLWSRGNECGTMDDGCDGTIELPKCKPGQSCRNHKCLCPANYPGGTLPPDPNAATTTPPPYHICPHHLNMQDPHVCETYCQQTGYTTGSKSETNHEQQCQCEEIMTNELGSQCPLDGPNSAPFLNHEIKDDGKLYCYYTPCTFIDEVVHHSASLFGSDPHDDAHHTDSHDDAQHTSHGVQSSLTGTDDYQAQNHECGYTLDSCGIQNFFGLRGGGCPEGYVCEQNTFACQETHELQSSLLELGMGELLSNPPPQRETSVRNVSFARHVGVASNAEISSVTSTLMRRAGDNKRNSVHSQVPPADHMAPLHSPNPMFQNPNPMFGVNSALGSEFKSGPHHHDDSHSSSHSSSHDSHGSSHGHDDTHSSSGHHDTHSSSHHDDHSHDAHHDAAESTTPDPHALTTTATPVTNASDYDDNPVHADEGHVDVPEHLVPSPLSCHAGQMEAYFFKSEDINLTHITHDGRCLPMKDIAEGVDFEDDPIEVGYSRRRRAQYWSMEAVGEVGFAKGTYIFKATYKAGIRIYLDNELVLDGWKESHSRVGSRGAPIAISHGSDEVVVKRLQIQYKALEADSFMKVDWEKVNILEMPFTDKCLTCKGVECVGGLRLLAIADHHYCQTSFTLDHTGKLRCDQAPHMCLHHMIGGNGVEPAVPYGLWGCAAADDMTLSRGQTWEMEHVDADHETRYKLKYNPAVYLVVKDVV
eukprot:gnl/MRDRNA2_/MRDRNA2_28132_c0_seq1.p1 gnl/MRDRNA2_/MRDRNA2_28132_c0~~gnl/MRDRNA2_/MRDRNA2_28132_c0_seq1.p1  ORF type:complete len:1293 (-),score=205.04 gnl/MRDRNA2_/MRDRNA2_28132_c0_seq1:9-3779(-)